MYSNGLILNAFNLILLEVFSTILPDKVLQFSSAQKLSTMIEGSISKGII